MRDMELESGRYFTEKDIDRKQKVAVLGASLAEELFGDEPAVGQTISVANTKADRYRGVRRKRPGGEYRLR